MPDVTASPAMTMENSPRATRGMRALLDATDRLDAGEERSSEERAELLERIRDFERAARQRVGEADLTRA